MTGPLGRVLQGLAESFDKRLQVWRKRRCLAERDNSEVL